MKATDIGTKVWILAATVILPWRLVAERNRFYQMTATGATCAWSHCFNDRISSVAPHVRTTVLKFI